MDYTENCHLPQWEENDRVLRTDFNEAFAKLEEVGTDHIRIQTIADGLIRDAYRREVQGRVCHGLAGDTDAMWVNALNTRTEAGGDGHGWNGRYGVSLGGADLPTLEGISRSIKEISYISAYSSFTYQSRNAAAEFVSDGYGTLAGLELYFARFNNSDMFEFTIKMTRTDTETLVAQAGPFTSAGTVYGVYQVNFPLESGVAYRLEFGLADGVGFGGSSGFCFASQTYGGQQKMTFSARKASGTITHTVIPPEGCREMIGLLRWSGDGTAEIKVNGKALTKAKTRETVSAEGAACTEVEYAPKALPEGDLTVALRMKQGTGPLKVFDYGLIWQ